MDITNPTDVKKRIKEARLALDLSQEALAREADVSTWTVNQIEKTGVAKMSTLAKLAEAMQVPMQYGPTRKAAK
jgi:DNA-binding XRE family transcriptional regulator